MLGPGHSCAGCGYLHDDSRRKLLVSLREQLLGHDLSAAPPHLTSTKIVWPPRLINKSAGRVPDFCDADRRSCADRTARRFASTIMSPARIPASAAGPPGSTDSISRPPLAPQANPS